MALSVPAVSVSKEVICQPEASAWAEARARVWNSIQEFGCVEILYDGLTAEIKSAAITAAADLVSLPPERKRLNQAPFPYLGYIGQVPGFAYESLAIDHVQNLAALQGFTDLMWPEGNSTFRDVIRHLAEALAALEAALRRMVLESLGLEEYNDIHMDITKYMLRLSEYAPPAIKGKAYPFPMLPSHTDTGLAALSIQNGLHGLEVRAKSGDWVRINPSSSPNSLIFLIGDSFRAWSNGKLYAPPHRVKVNTGEKRIAILFFAIPKEEVAIEAPAELVNGDHKQALFKPFTFLEYVEKFQHLHLAAGEEGSASVLTTFCGTGAPENAP